MFDGVKAETNLELVLDGVVLLEEMGGVKVIEQSLS